MNLDYTFNSNYNLDSEYLSCPDNFCEICSSRLDNNCVTLECNHCFHYDCLLKSMKIRDIKFYNMQCPYCRKSIDFLPLLPGEKPIKNIHKEYNEFIQKENSKYFINNKIKITNGKYKNQQGIIKQINDKTIQVNLDISNITVNIKKNFLEI